MLRLLGILTIVNLLFGGHRRRRALRRGILFGAILGFLAHRDIDTERAAEEFRERTGKARETLRQTAREIRQEIREAKKEIREARRAEQTAPEAKREASRVRREAPQAKREIRRDEIAVTAQRTSAEAAANENLVQELERNARTAAMMSDVPVLHFPEDDPKYNSSKKYGYA